MGMEPKYRNAVYFNKKVDEYFDECERDHKPPTITGLSLFLGFKSRQALLNYKSKPKFIDSVERAHTRVEQYAEEMLYNKDSCNGAKFNLSCNFGWSDKHTLSVDDSVKEANVLASDMTMSEKMAVLERIKELTIEN